MQSKDWKVRSLAFLALLPVALMSGCSDQNEESDPVEQVSEETAVGAALATTEFIDGFVSSIGAVLSGDLTGGLTTIRVPSSMVGDFSRDEACLNQEPTCQQTFDGTTHTATCSSNSTDCSLIASVSVQFRDDLGQAQAEPDSRTEELSYNVDMTLDFMLVEGPPPGRAADFIDYFLDFNNDMSVRDIQQQVFSAQGTGSMDMAISGEVDGQTFAEAAGISWSYDLDVPAEGGCSTGSIQITVGQYTAIAVYGSAGNYTVTVYLNGTQVHQEQGTSACGLAG